MKKALLVGYNYKNMEGSELFGPEDDVKLLNQVISKHFDGSINFETKIISTETEMKRKELMDSLIELFNQDPQINSSLFYFSGHGSQVNGKTFLVTSDAATGVNFGIEFSEIWEIVKNSKINNKIIILDCCFSGSFGIDTDEFGLSNIGIIPENCTVLTASYKTQPSVEVDGQGLFTKYLIEALNGGVSDILGNVTLAGIYAYLDKMFGAWEQRPSFMTNSSKFQEIKKVRPAIELQNLKKITTYFKNYDSKIKLTPEHEFKHKQKSVEKKARKPLVEMFKNLQQFFGQGLVVPIGASEPYMYFAAMENKHCELTEYGKIVWRLVKQGKL